MAVNNKQRPNTASLVYGKVPPQATELEEAVLGAIMLEKEKIDEVLEIIQSPQAFYADAHQKIYAAILRLMEKAIPVDLLTVTDELRKANELEVIGGAYYLTRLTMSVVSSAHVVAHAYLIIEKYMQRELIRISGNIIGEAYEDSTDVFKLLDAAEQDLFQTSSLAMRQPYQHVKEPMFELMNEMEEQRANPSEFTGVTTGYKKLNDKTTGWQKTDLIIIAARPAVGKTAFTLNLAINCAKDPISGGPVGVFNLEMGKKQLLKRMLSCVSGVELENINKPKRLVPHELQELAKASNYIASLPIFIDDTAGLNIVELRSKARNMVKKKGVKLIIIDYLQLIEVNLGKGVTREQEVAKISRDLKKLAKELEVPVIALSQLARAVERENRPPVLSDLRESGAIEQDADGVVILYRPTKEELKQKPILKHFVLYKLLKSRNSGLQKFAFYVNNKIQRWEERELDEVTLEEQANPTPPTPDEKDDLPF